MTDTQNNICHTDILIAAAVAGEVEYIAARLEAVHRDTVGRRPCIAGRLDGAPVRILTTGPGMVNAAQALTAAIESRRPKIILQTGCAGAFRESGLNIGDIAVATEEIDLYLGIERIDDNPLDPLPTPLPFPVLESGGEACFNRFPLDRKLADAAFEALSGEQTASVQVKRGPFVTVAFITATDRRAAAIHRRYHPCMESMEGAAMAHVARHYAIPMIEVRAASNFVGKRNRDEWRLTLAFERCGRATAEVVRQLAEAPSLW